MLDALGKPSSMLPAVTQERIAAMPANQNITDAIGSGPFMLVNE